MQKSAYAAAALMVCALYGVAHAQGPANAQSPANLQQETRSARLPIAGAGRPANVPEGYLVTPFGYLDSSCVVQLTKGERMLASGRVQHANGMVDATAKTCARPRYTRDGGEVSARAGAAVPQVETAPEIDGWLENANAVAEGSDSFGALIARWLVPPQPARDDGQVLYFFPGLEDINDTISILQPVMAWYHGQWSIASWNCCINGVVAESNSVNVSSGDEIFGSVTNNCPGQVTCSAWNVLSLDMSTGQGAILENTPSEGQVFNWAFGAVLEPYYVVACTDFPRDKRISFEEIEIFDQNLNPVRHIQWSSGWNSSETPQCNFGVKTNPHAVTLLY